MVYQRRAPRKMYRKKYVRKTSTAAKANKALYLAKKAQNQKELKWIDTTVSNLTVGVTPVLENLSSISQGLTNNQRDGNVIYPTSIKFRATMVMDPGIGSTNVRLIIFRWISEVPAGVSDILQTSTVESFKSDSNRYNSQILYDKVITLSDGTTSQRFIPIKRRLKGLIAYPETGTVSGRNGIWLLMLSNSPDVTPVSVDYASRIYFKDA